MKHIVSTSWLEKHLRDPDLIVLDASQSSSMNNLENAIQDKFIPGAISFNLKEFSDPSSELPNTLPSQDYFQKKARELGINSTNKIVVYDNAGIYWSPRVWWMFHVMGHRDVAVLNGGLPAWIKENKQTVNSLLEPQGGGDFTASLDKKLLKSIDDISSNLDSKEFEIVDARSKGRFDGTAPEPRKGLKSGHIPNSFNVPFDQVLNKGNFKSNEELEKIFQDFKPDNNLAFSCGSGLTACIVSLAHTLITDKVSPIYDGSWTEWAQSGKPIAVNYQ